MSGGIASMTRTRVDSAAKHIMAAKVDTNLMKVYSGVENADLQTMHHKRLELLTEKDDLVLNVSRKLACLDTRTFHAYPAVVSTLAKCTPAYRMVVSALFSQRSSRDFYGMVKAIGATDKVAGVHDFVFNQRAQGNRTADSFARKYPDVASLRAQGTPEGKALVQELRNMPFYQLQVGASLFCRLFPMQFTWRCVLLICVFCGLRRRGTLSGARGRARSQGTRCFRCS